MSERLANLTRDDLEQAVDAVLERRRGIPGDKHRVHHEFIEAEIERRRVKSEQRASRAESWRRIRESVIGWLIITTLAAIGSAVYVAASWLREALARGQ